MMSSSTSDFRHTRIQRPGRKGWRWAALFLGGLAAAFLAICCWQDRTPRITVAWQQAPSSNAYDDFAGAARLLRDKSAMDDAEGHLTKKVYSLAEKEALVQENASALEALRTGLTHLYVQPRVRGLSGGHSYLMGDRPLARLLVLEARVREAQGNWEGAARSDLDCIQMGVAIPHGGDLTAMLIGGGIEASGQRQLRLDFPHLNAAQTRPVNTRLQQIVTDRQSFADTLQIEKWSTEAFLLALMRHPNWRWELIRYVGVGDDAARFMETSTESEYWTERVSQLEDLLRLAPYSKQQIINDYDDYMNHLIAADRISFNPPPPDHADPFIDAVAPVCSDAAFRQTKTETAGALLVTALALHAYKLDHHLSPTDLQQLVPAYLSRIPTDPFSVNCAIRYIHTDQQDLIYSVGPDGKDNQGKPCMTKQGRQWVEPDSRGDMLAGMR